MLSAKYFEQETLNPPVSTNLNHVFRICHQPQSAPEHQNRTPQLSAPPCGSVGVEVWECGSGSVGVEVWEWQCVSGSVGLVVQVRVCEWERVW